jgi:hypothetical protein
MNPFVQLSWEFFVLIKDFDIVLDGRSKFVGVCFEAEKAVY